MRVFAAAVALVLLLAGCVPTSPSPSPTPEASSTPVFASEEEALAAAEEAYAAYQAASDAVGASGGLDLAPLEPLLTDEQLQREKEGFELYRSNNWRTTGASTFDSVRLQSYEAGEPARVTVYLCSDVTMLRLIDATGADVTPPERPNRIPLQVSFEVRSGQAQPLVSGSDVWEGDNFCA
jgi:hypothetical protein